MKRALYLILAVTVVLAARALPAYAHMRGGIWIGPAGGPWWGPPAYPYYASPPVVIEQQPPVYEEREPQQEEQPYLLVLLPGLQNLLPLRETMSRRLHHVVNKGLHAQGVCPAGILSRSADIT